jgi:hypothetical protein
MTRRSVPQCTILAWLLGALLVVPLLAACEATPTVRKTNPMQALPAQALHFSFVFTGMYAYSGVTAESDPNVQLAVQVDDPR